VTTRPITSVAPPGGNGTIIRTCPVGYDCACASEGVAAPANSDEIRKFLREIMFVCSIPVMPAHSRPKDGVASLAYVAGIHVLLRYEYQRRGWPEQVRP